MSNITSWWEATMSDLIDLEPPFQGRVISESELAGGAGIPRFATVTELLADTSLDVETGDYVAAAGHLYVVVAEDGHVQTAGGVELDVSPINGVWNAEAFGAVADNSTDAREPTQAAVDAADAVGGGTVLLSGKFRFSKNPTTNCGILVHDNINLTGTGVGSTVLSWVASETAGGSHFLIGGGGLRDNVRIANMTLDGVKVERFGESPPWHIQGEGIELDGTNLLFENLVVRNFTGEGIDTDAGSNIRYLNIIAEDNEGNGIHCSDPGLSNVIGSNIITRNNAGGRFSSSSRHGGLVLRGSNMSFSNILSVNDWRCIDAEAVGGTIAITGFVGDTNRPNPGVGGDNAGGAFRVSGTGEVSMTSVVIDHNNTDIACFTDAGLLKLVNFTLRSDATSSCFFVTRSLDLTNFLFDAPASSHGLNCRDNAADSRMSHGRIVTDGFAVRTRNSHNVNLQNVTGIGGGVTLETGTSVIMNCDMPDLTDSGGTGHIIRNNIIGGTFVESGTGGE
jgi:hypothetical protein